MREFDPLAAHDTFDISVEYVLGDVIPEDESSDAEEDDCPPCVFKVSSTDCELCLSSYYEGTASLLLEGFCDRAKGLDLVCPGISSFLRNWAIACVVSSPIGTPRLRASPENWL